MHAQEPAPGGLPARPDGNRPANNARLSTPGTVKASSFQGSEEAIDFLGLDEEFASPAPEHAPARPSRAHAAAQREEQVWEEYDAQDGQQVVSLDDDEGDFSQEEDERGEVYVGEDAPEEGVLATWKEDGPRARGSGRLIGLSAGVAVAGMLTVALLKLVSSSSSSEELLPEPLAAHRNPLPSTDQMQAPESAGSGPVEPQRLVFDAQGQARPAELRPELAAPPQDPATEARERFEAARGDEPPPGFDPAADTPPPPEQPFEEPAYEASGLSEPHVSAEIPTSAVDPEPTPSESTFASTTSQTLVPPAGGLTSGTPSLAALTLPTLESSVAQAPSSSAPSEAPIELASAAPAVLDSQPLEIVGAPSPSTAPSSAVSEAAEVSSIAPATSSTASSRSWLDLASLRAGRTQPSDVAQSAPPPIEAPSSASVASAAQSAPVVPWSEPESAAATEPAPASGDAVERLLAAREARPSAIASEPPVPPDPGPGGLRQASSSDYKTIWQSSQLPGAAQYSANPRLLTPNVGRVRALLKSGDVFEGRLFAVGEGNLWIESESGRMGLSSERLASLEQLVTPEGTPALGAPGSQDLAGMERVRVKTPGGVFYGKVIARDAARTTIVTEDGARLTLDSKMVELLVDAPNVTIKGAAPEPAVKKP